MTLPLNTPEVEGSVAGCDCFSFGEWSDFFHRVCLLLFLRCGMSQILSLEQCWFVINPGCIYFRSQCLLMKQGLVTRKPQPGFLK